MLNFTEMKLKMNRNDDVEFIHKMYTHSIFLTRKF